MRYQHKKTGKSFDLFITIPSIKKLMGVESMADGKFICGKDLTTKTIFPICYAYDEHDKNVEMIKRIIAEDYDIIEEDESNLSIPEIADKAVKQAMSLMTEKEKAMLADIFSQVELA